MRILFVHQNFPGQFRHVAAALARDPANRVVAFTMNDFASAPGIRVVRYAPSRRPGTVHPWLAETEVKVIRGEAAYRAARALAAEGFAPDLICAHPGWGECLFLKDVWPAARLVMYCEFFYRWRGADVGFDPEFPSADADGAACRLRMKNVASLLSLDLADGGIAPTEWQRSTFPELHRDRIAVIHDGIDTDALRPDPARRLTLAANAPGAEPRAIAPEDEVITFVNRNLEPYRGYHIFMRALPRILAARPRARVLIVGGTDTGYGAPPPAGRTWRDIFLDEVRGRIDLSRVHFLGRVPYGQLVALYQRSSVHVYLTYPFVLSWSLLEAMSCGCAIVASDTAPLREAIADGETGRLVDFFAPDRLADAVVQLLADPAERARLGASARDFARATYDLRRVCLPRQLACLRGG